jgi:hypothetical protein
MVGGGYAVLFLVVLIMFYRSIIRHFAAEVC